MNTLPGSRGDLFVMFFSCFLREMCVNVRVFVFALSEMIPGSGWQNSSQGSLRGTRLRRRGEALGRVVAEVCAFPRAAGCLLVS